MQMMTAKPGLLLLCLGAFLMGCCPDPQVIVRTQDRPIRVPRFMTEPTPTPESELAVNGDLAKHCFEAQPQALESCNADKARIRAWSDKQAGN